MDTISQQGVAACWAVFALGAIAGFVSFCEAADGHRWTARAAGLLCAVCTVAVVLRVLPLVFT